MSALPAYIHFTENPSVKLQEAIHYLKPDQAVILQHGRTFAAGPAGGLTADALAQAYVGRPA